MKANEKFFNNFERNDFQAWRTPTLFDYIFKKKEEEKNLLEKVNLHIETYVRRSFSGIGIHVLHFMPCGVHEEFFFIRALHIKNNKYNSALINNRQMVIMKTIYNSFWSFIRLM